MSSFANGQCIPTIFSLLLTRMQDQMKDTKTPKYCRYFIHFACLFAAMYGGQRLYDVFEALTPGLTVMIIQGVWSHNNQACCSMDKLELKQLIVGATKFFLDTPINQDPRSWTAVLSYTLALVDAESGHKVLDDDIHFVDEEAEAREFDSTYSKLAYATIPDAGVTPEIAQASSYFISSLAKFCAARPGQYLSAIQMQLSDAKKANEAKTLQQLVEANGVTLV